MAEIVYVLTNETMLGLVKIPALGQDVDITVRAKPRNRAHGRIRVIDEAHA